MNGVPRPSGAPPPSARRRRAPIRRSAAAPVFAVLVACALWATAPHPWRSTLRAEPPPPLSTPAAPVAPAAAPVPPDAPPAAPAAAPAPPTVAPVVPPAAPAPPAVTPAAPAATPLPPAVAPVAPATTPTPPAAGPSPPSAAAEAAQPSSSSAPLRSPDADVEDADTAAAEPEAAAEPGADRREQPVEAGGILEAAESGTAGGFEDGPEELGVDAGRSGPVENPGTIFRQGQEFLRDGAPELAEETWRSLLELFPRHYDTHLALGRLYLGRSPELAARHLEMAVRLRPASFSAQYLLGRSLEVRGRLEDAAEAYRRTIVLNAAHREANRRLRAIIQQLRARQSVVERMAGQFWANPSLAALTLLGRVIMQESSPRQALWEFELLRERLTDLPEIHLWIARAQRRLGSLSGEVAAYRDYLAVSPNAVEVWLLVLDRLIEGGRFRDAAEPLRVLETRAGDGRLTRHGVARLHLLQSRLLVAQGRPAQAADRLLAAGRGGHDSAEVTGGFARMVALFPESAPVRMAQGEWQRAAGDDEAAAATFLRAGQLDAAMLGRVEEVLARLARGGPAQPVASLALGELALARGDPDAALAWLRAVPADRAEAGRAALLLGRIHRARGELDESLDAFTRYVFAFPDRAGIAFARGNVFWEIGKVEAAVAMWEEHLGELGAYPEALRRLAAFRQERGQMEAEIAARRALREAAPDDLANRIRLGDTLMVQGRPGEATAEWESVAARKTGDQALLLRLGRAYLRRNERDKAVDALWRAAQIGELELALAEPLARHLMEQQRPAEALEFFWQVYKQQPDHPAVAAALPELVLQVAALPEQRLAAARMARDRGGRELAIALLEEQVRLTPDHEEGRLMLGELYLEDGAPAEAERVVVAGAPATLRAARGLRILAEAQERQRKEEALAATLAGLVALEPASIPLRKQLGLLLHALRKPREAVPHLELALARNGAEPAVKLALADSLGAAGELERAAALFQELLAAEPSRTGLRRKLIRILQKTRNWSALTAHLEVVVAENPRDGDARYSLLSAYLNQFQTEEARPHFEALSKSSPGRVRHLRQYFR